MNDELIQLCALAVRGACRRMTPHQLKALEDSVEQACDLPPSFGWDRKVTAHAEFLNLISDVTGDPVLALVLRGVPGLLYDLMSAVGPATDGMIAASRRRLIGRLRARDADGAALEMELHLKGLTCSRRLSQHGAGGIAV